MFRPTFTAVDGSLAATALVAALPLLTVFLLLGVFRARAWVAGLAGLGVALVVAVVGMHMPVQLAALSATEGAAYGLFPIVTIVVMAVWIYQLTVRSGHFADLRTMFNLVSDDPRIQGIVVAFCFGGLLEALAGFGAPVAITAVMLVSIGFAPMKAAATVLLANTAPVAFGAVGIPIVTAGTLTGIHYPDIGAVIGRQTPLLALFVPALLVIVVDGRHGLRETWPVALVGGAAFGAAQFASSNYFSVELTDIVASLVGLIAVVGFLRVWQPQGTAAARRRILTPESPPLPTSPTSPTPPVTGVSTGSAHGGGQATAVRADVVPELSRGQMVMAFLPYLVIVAVFAVAKLVTPVKTFLTDSDVPIRWPGLAGHVLTASGKVSTTATYTLPWLSGAGTLLFVSGAVVTAAYRMRPAVAAQVLGRTISDLRFAILTVGSVLALAYVMNLSGQTITIGQWLAAGTGGFFAFLSPVLGWIGTAVTGSDTSANALFATLQQSAAARSGLDPTLLVAANTSGGVVGKMISPQNLTIAATAVGLTGQESAILRKVVLWSLGLLVALCTLVFLQSNVLAWMLP